MTVSIGAFTRGGDWCGFVGLVVDDDESDPCGGAAKEISPGETGDGSKRDLFNGIAGQETGKDRDAEDYQPATCTTESSHKLPSVRLIT